MRVGSGTGTKTGTVGVGVDCGMRWTVGKNEITEIKTSLKFETAKRLAGDNSNMLRL